MSECATCSQGSTVPTNMSPDLSSGSSNEDGLTLNEGKGIRSNVMLSGPLAETVKGQLDIIFEKKPLDLSNGTQEEPPTFDAAKESIAQDHALREAFAEAANKPENEVILRGINVQDIKEHVKRMLENKPKAEDLENTQEINVVTGTFDDLTNGREMSAYDISNATDVILVAKPVVGSVQGQTEDPLIVKRYDSNPIINVLMTPVKVTAETGEYPSVTDKIEALERIYDGLKIHASAEAFAASLIKRLCK